MTGISRLASNSEEFYGESVKEESEPKPRRSERMNLRLPASAAALVDAAVIIQQYFISIMCKNVNARTQTTLYNMTRNRTNVKPCSVSIAHKTQILYI